MMIWAKAKLVAGVVLASVITTAGGVALIAATTASSPRQLAAPASQPERRDYARLAPYDAIRWKDNNTPEIHVAGTWYGWLALDEADVAKIIEFTRNTYKPREVRMRIGEDLVEVLTRMGNPPGPTVNGGSGWREAPDPTWVKAAGCYAWQVDGLGFSETIVVSARSHR